MWLFMWCDLGAPLLARKARSKDNSLSMVLPQCPLGLVFLPALANRLFSSHCLFSTCLWSVAQVLYFGQMCSRYHLKFIHFWSSVEPSGIPWLWSHFRHLWQMKLAMSGLSVVPVEVSYLLIFESKFCILYFFYITAKRVYYTDLVEIWMEPLCIIDQKLDARYLFWL